MRRIPKRDPSAVFIREAIAQRRNAGKKCVCGEIRPQALARGKSKSCAKCKRKKRGHKTTDNHHVAGEANDPTTIPVPVNDHLARLNADQMDWPKETRENRDGSPLVAAAGCIRGFADTSVYLIEQIICLLERLVYLIERLVLRHAEMLEVLDAYLVRTSGRKWWLKTELKRFAPKR